MVNFEHTDLKIIGWEIDDKQKLLLYVLLDKNNADKFDIDHFMNEILSLELENISEEIKDNKYELILDKFGIIEAFDQDEISDLTQQGEIDPEDIHQSLYELVKEERL